MLLLMFKSLAAQVGGFRESRKLTLTRRLIVSCWLSARRLEVDYLPIGVSLRVIPVVAHPVSLSGQVAIFQTLL